MALILAFGAAIAHADTLELRNGSLIKGRFVAGTETEIKFQVDSSVQRYNVADIISLKFDSDGAVYDLPRMGHQAGDAPASITIPAGTQVSVRTIDSIDSTKNHVGDRFQATLEEPLVVDGNVVVAKGADVFGRLAESKTSGTFAGRSELRLELTGIVVNGQMVALVTREYQLSGKSRGASTAKRTVDGAAVGTVIGAITGGGRGAAIGAGLEGAAGAGSEIITKGDQVKVPSETLLDFTVQQAVSLLTRQNQMAVKGGPQRCFGLEKSGNSHEPNSMLAWFARPVREAETVPCFAALAVDWTR